MQSLPIDAILPELTASIRENNNLVLEAPPGAGKTTRVPPALLTAGAGEVWVLEPRRLAARMAARRVAEERGERLGETVGYQVRFDEVAGPHTRLRFLTEGVLTRRLLSDPQLKHVGAVVLDEFHERHLQADLALALLRRLQCTTRPDLKLVVMSATLAAAPVAGFLAAPTLRSEGRRFDVTIEHLPRSDDRPLAQQIASALRRLLAEKLEGDVLVFLPGAAEIRRAQEQCADLAAQHDLLILPLHGELPAAEQDRAVRPADKRKLILSTNVAESSVTIDGVTAVIDTGLARVAGHSPWSGLPTLNVARVSCASAVQRAGRAGRTQPGRCLRLYTAQDFAARPEHEAPEIARLNLTETALALHAAGSGDLSQFGWFEAPPAAALQAADELLRRLGAIDARGVVTAIGQRMLRFPLHPRQARMLIEAETRNVAAAACLVAALIGERDIRATEMFKGDRQRTVHASGPSDLLERMDAFAEAERARFEPARLRALGLNVGATLAVERVRRQLLKYGGRSAERGTKQADAERELLISILSGYPDRVARRRAPNSDEWLLAGGGAVQLSSASVVRQAEFLVAVEAEERRDARSKTAAPLVRLASAIEPEWLLDLFADDLRETVETQWNAEAERVEAVRRLVYDQLTLDERRVNDANDAAVTQALADAALGAGWQRFVDAAEVARWLARVEFTARTFPAAGLPTLNDDDVRAALVEMCAGRRSFAELREAGKRGELQQQLTNRLSGAQQRLLRETASEHVAIAGRRNVRVNYERGQTPQTPWIASRLQDFFGMKDGPRIAGGRVAVVLHLLAPNQRAVQVTTDLAGFWLRHYPSIRRELSRRYPRHAWPENPLAE